MFRITTTNHDPAVGNFERSITPPKRIGEILVHVFIRDSIESFPPK